MVEKVQTKYYDEETGMVYERAIEIITNHGLNPEQFMDRNLFKFAKTIMDERQKMRMEEL